MIDGSGQRRLRLRGLVRLQLQQPQVAFRHREFGFQREISRLAGKQLFLPANGPL